MGTLVSVVVPCYNEAAVIDATYQRLTTVMDSLSASKDVDYELVFVNDGSQDQTLSLLQGFHASHPKGRGQVVVVCLARNFGHQVALSAGLEIARGDAVVAIDADLQDPPEVIEEMYQRYLDGADVAYGLRNQRPGDGVFKWAATRVFYRLLSRITRVDIPLDTGDFRLINRRVLDVLNSMPERHRYIRGMVPWVGFRQEPVSYDRDRRHSGESKYSYSRLFGLAFEGITSFSHTPLRLAYIIGFVVALFCLIYGGFVVATVLIQGSTDGIKGWASMMVAITFLGSVQLITLGLLGDYIGRIYDEVKRRPLYVVNDDQSRLPPDPTPRG